MFKFTSKEMSERIAKLLAGELEKLHVVVVKCPVETLPMDSIFQPTEIVRTPALDVTAMDLEEFSQTRIVPAATAIALSIAERARRIFTLAIPLPRGAWSTFEKIGEFGFRVIEQYDINADEMVVRIDVMYAVAQ